MSATDETTIRLAVPADLPAAARGFVETFQNSVWARVGAITSEAYLAHFVRDPHEFLVVADHPRLGIVGACNATLRFSNHRQAINRGNVGRFGTAIVADVLRDPNGGLEFARRVGSGVVGAIRRRLVPDEPEETVEYFVEGWPRQTAPPACCPEYFVTPNGRGQRLAVRMTLYAIERFIKQGFDWCQINVAPDNIASQICLERAGFQRFCGTPSVWTYRRYIGEGEVGDVEVCVADGANAEVAQAWNELLEKTPDGSGFHAWGWIKRHAAEAQTSRFGIVRFKGLPVAVFGFKLDPDGRLRWVADERSNYGGPVYDPVHLQSVLVGFRQLVFELRPDVVDLKGLRERSPFFQAVRDLVLPEHGPAFCANTIGCPEMELGEPWAAVWARRKKKHRANWRRALKKLERLGSVEFTELSAATEILEAMPAAVKLYEARWAGLNVHQAFGGAQVEFQRKTAEELAEHGNVLMSVLRVDGEMIAFAYSLRQGGVSSSYTLAHDERYAPYSPGQLLLIEMLKRAAERGDPMFDFSVGDESYKDGWSTRRQEVFRLVWGRGARRVTLIDTIKAELRARPTLRRLKREGPRAVLARGPKPSAVTWCVQRIPDNKDATSDAESMTLGQMRSELSEELFVLAVERAFRGDTLRLLRDGAGPAAVVWEAAASRREAATADVALGPNEPVYLQPRALRPGVDLSACLAGLRPGVLVSTEVFFQPALAQFEAERNTPWR